MRVENEEKPILQVKNLNLNSGQTLIVSGESGSGKTTFLNLISSLETPNSGKIWWDDKDICTLNPIQKDKFRAQNLGIVMQNFHLIKNLSAIDNIMLLNLFLDGDNIKKDYALSLLEQVGIKNPNLEVKFNSRGQMQRIAIARALSNNPKVLICDEPTASLDLENSQNIANLLENFASKNSITMIIATHDNKIKSKFKNILEIKKDEAVVWNGNLAGDGDEI